MSQAEKFAACIATTRVWVNVSWTALRVNVLPNLCYSMTTAHFTPKQLKKLVVLIDNAFIPKLGKSWTYKSMLLLNWVALIFHPLQKFRTRKDFL